MSTQNNNPVGLKNIYINVLLMLISTSTGQSTILNFSFYLLELIDLVQTLKQEIYDSMIFLVSKGWLVVIYVHLFDFY